MSSALTQIAQRVRIIAQWQIHRAYANTRKGGKVVRMAKPSAFLQKIEARHKRNMNLQRAFTIQQCEDMALITLNEDFGFGPKRAQDFRKKFRQTMKAYAELCVDDANGDDELTYTKAVIDRELQKVMGEDFVPWDVRFPPEVFR